MKTMIKYCILLLGFMPFVAVAQTFDLGSWNIINLKYNVNNNWSVFGEAQLRSLKFYNNFHYYEYKAGVNFKAHKNLTLALGAGSYQTYKELGDFVLPKNNDEFRIWPQVLVFQSIGKLKIEQRYRAEFRFTSNGYRNRFRYRVGLNYPFGKESNGYKPFQFNVSNELFFTNKVPYFERNRLLFTFNYKPTKQTNIQVGYLHQFDYKINDETGKDFLQVGYFIEIFRKQSTNNTIEKDLKDN
jgi:long-subunit fatty acid transport protein